MSNIISIILVLASFGLFFGYIDPTYTAIQSSRTDKATYDTALANSKVLESERDALLQKFNAMDSTDLAKLTKLLPDNIDNIRLIIDIDNMAKTYGMRIRNFKTNTNQASTDTIGANTTPYGTLTLTFTTTASYNTFLAFLHDLERSLRVLDVTAVQFSSSDVSAVNDYNVTVNTYWLK